MGQKAACNFLRCYLEILQLGSLRSLILRDRGAENVASVVLMTSRNLEDHIVGSRGGILGLGNLAKNPLLSPGLA
jgi:hypothetical protein